MERRLISARVKSWEPMLDQWGVDLAFEGGKYHAYLVGTKVEAEAEVARLRAEAECKIIPWPAQ